MKKLAYFLAGLIAASILISSAHAQTIYPNRGGTGVTTTPSVGQVLVGQPGGVYAPQATSTLGIQPTLTGGSTGTLTVWTGSGTLGATSSPTVSFITATSGTSTLPRLSTSFLSIAGDYLTDLTGTGLQIVSGALQTTLGTLVDLVTEVSGTLSTMNGGTGTTTPSAFLFGTGSSIVSTSSISASYIDPAIARDSELHSAVTLSGALDYITLAGQDIVRGAIDLATDVMGILAVGDGGTGSDTLPATGQVLVGQGDGTYEPQATTTLGLGTVTSVSMTVPTGLSVSGSPITKSGTLAVTLDAGYVVPTTTRAANWDIAYSWGNHASAGYLSSVATTTVRGMVSATSPLSYNSGTGAFSISTAGDWAGTFDGQEGSYYLSRANHTGTQAASTISDFSSTARGLFSSSADGLTYTSGTGAFSLTSGYVIPTTTRAVGWDAAAASTTVLSNSYIRGLLSSSATGLTYTPSTGAFSLAGGYLIPLTASTTNWNTFYDTPSNRITAGTGLSWSGNTLNASGGGTVTSVDMTVPTGLTVTGNPVTTSGTLAIALAGGYSIPTTAKQTEWDTAYTNRITSATSPLAISSNVISITNDGIGDTQLAFNTGQNLTTASSPTFAGATIGTLTGLIKGASGVLSAATAGTDYLAPITGTTGQSVYMSGTNTIGATSSVFITSSGAVGIGTTSPSNKLHVEAAAATAATFARTTASSNISVEFKNNTSSWFAGQGTAGNFHIETDNALSTASLFTFTPSGTLAVTGAFLGQASDAVGSPSFSWSGDTNTGMWRPAADTIAFSTAGSEEMRIMSGGNVGIGTTSPMSTLAVEGTGSTTLTIKAGSTRPAALDFFRSTANTARISIPSSSGMEFYAGNDVTTPKALITSAGNFGIGTSSPTAKLHVAGNGLFAGNLQAANLIATGTVTLPALASPTGSIAAFDTSGTLIGTTTSSGVTSLSVVSANGFAGSSSGGATPALTLSTTITGLLKGNGTAISAATPGTDYQAPIAGSTGQAVFMSGTNTVGATSTLFYSATNHRVGINTTSPLGPLHVVNGDSQAMILEGPAGVVNSAAMKWYAGANEKAAFTWQDTTNFLRMYAVTGSMGLYADNITGRGITILTSSGNTGVGTSTPVSKLDVVGTSSGTILTLFSNAGTKFMEMLNTGVTTLLGAWDFGGADSVEIPNGSAPTVDAIGEIAFDTTDNQLLIATSTTSGSPAVLPTEVSMGGFLMSSTTAPFFNGFVTGQSIPFKIQRDGYIVKEIHCDIDGGTSIVINFDNGSGNTETITCDTDGASDTDITSNNTVAAGSVSTSIETGTVTGSPNYLRVSVFGVYVRE